MEKMNHDYSKLINFLNAVKNNPLYPQSASLALLNPFSISTKPKGEDTMLDIADFVAHAVYQCLNRTPTNYSIPEPRYLREMCSRLAGDKQNRALGVGLKCIHSLQKIDADPEIQEFFKSIKVAPISTRK